MPGKSRAYSDALLKLYVQMSKCPSLGRPDQRKIIVENHVKRKDLSMYSCMIFLSKSFALPEEGQNNCGNEGPYTKGDLILKPDFYQNSFAPLQADQRF